MPNRPLAILFDVNETLTDLTPLRDRLESVGAARSQLDAWFAATLRDGFALTAAGGYAEFADIARAALRAAFARAEGLTRDADAAVDEVLAGFPALDLHPDVPAGMRRLRDAGMRLATLTNGSAEMSRGSFERAGVLDLLERRLSVSEPRRWKPAPEPYRWAAATLGVAPREAALIAVHPWDIDGAKRAGLIAAWIDRRGVPYPPVFEPPDVTGVDLPAVAAELIALDPA